MTDHLKTLLNSGILLTNPVACSICAVEFMRILDSFLSFVFTITRYFHKYLLLILDISHIKYSLYQFSTATITNYHKLINLKKFISLHFCWSDIRMSAGLFFPECSRGEMSPCLFQLLEITYIP